MNGQTNERAGLWGVRRIGEETHRRGRENLLGHVLGSLFTSRVFGGNYGKMQTRGWKYPICVF